MKEKESPVYRPSDQQDRWFDHQSREKSTVYCSPCLLFSFLFIFIIIIIIIISASDRKMVELPGNGRFFTRPVCAAFNI